MIELLILYSRSSTQAALVASAILFSRAALVEFAIIHAYTLLFAQEHNFKKISPLKIHDLLLLPAEHERRSAHGYYMNTKFKYIYIYIYEISAQID